jgi:hypothetical protein
MRRVVVNAIVPPPNGGVISISPPMPLASVVEVARRFVALAEPNVYVGHQSTALVLGCVAHRDVYTPRPGDVALVVTLAWRPAAPGDVQVGPDDLLVRLAYYGDGAGCPCGDSGCHGDAIIGPYGGPGGRVLVWAAGLYGLDLASREGASVGCVYRVSPS